MRSSIFTVVVALVVGVQAEAAPILLSDLIAPGAAPITVGDKVFTDFTASFVGVGNFLPQDATGVTVTPFIDEDGLECLRFQGNFTVFAPPPSSLDVLIGYTVTSTGNPITDIHLEFDGVATNGALTTVIETVENPLTDTVVGQAMVDSQNPPGSLQATVSFDGLQSVDVLKDMALGAVQPGSQASFSFVEQCISQSAIPEPATLTLLLGGLIALGLRRRLAR